MRQLYGALLTVLISVSSASARHEVVPKQVAFKEIAGDFCFQRVSDTTTNLWLAFSNRMAIGRPFADAYPIPDDDELTGNLRQSFSARFPGGSLKEYLYGAGLWVGGIKGNDTLVSHAFDMAYPVPELIPPRYPEGAIQTFADWADLEHAAVAYDTLIAFDTLFRCLTGDCRDWYPLGLRVRSHSYVWESPPYDNAVVVEYIIENISSTPIEKGWAGIYADCDIGTMANAGGDDLSGYLPGRFDSAGNWTPLHLAYSIDMNGDPGPWGFDSTSTNGTFGVQVLDLSVASYRVNFNWWAAGTDEAPSWGPRQNSAAGRDLGGSFGAPYGDSNKYFVMSYPEVDYNQIEAGLIHPGWVTADDSGKAQAQGGDTRFLISAGPFDLAPGDEVTFTVAYLGADNVIKNPYVNYWFEPTDPSSVSDYYEMMHLDGLTASAETIAALKTEGYGYPPPGPPTQFRLTDFGDTWASFAWSPKIARDLIGYRLLYRTASGIWSTAAVVGAEDTACTISDLEPRMEYAFAVVAVDGDGAGKSSPELHLFPAAPHPPRVLSGNARNGFPVLHWLPSEGNNVASYAIYRIDDETDEISRIAVTADTSYIDHGAAIGVIYTYYVTAVSSEGWESPPSPTVRLLPALPTEGILVIDQNSRKLTSNLVFQPSFFDSLAAAALNGMPYEMYRFAEQGALSVAELSRYALVIVSSENLDGSLQKDLADSLRFYLTGGGKLVLLLCHAAVDRSAENEPQSIHYTPGSLFAGPLFLDSSYIGPVTIQSGYNLLGDLIGATSAAVDLPDQRWDSVRVNQFGYHANQGIPFAGAIWPHAPAEIIYTYQSSAPDSITQGRVNGIRYRGEDYSFYLLNFPLSLMASDSAAALLHRIVLDLKVTFICGDVNDDHRLDIADIAAYAGYLFGGVAPPNLTLAGDTNCDGEYSMLDLVELINFYFHQGLMPGCCP